jgi:hypothetical protein
MGVSVIFWAVILHLFISDLPCAPNSIFAVFAVFAPSAFCSRWVEKRCNSTRGPASTSALQAASTLVLVPTDEPSYRAVAQGFNAKVRRGKVDMLLSTTKIHDKLFAALFAWLAK